MPAGNLLYYALVALVIAIIAAVLGFGGIAGAAAGIAKILFLHLHRDLHHRSNHEFHRKRDSAVGLAPNIRLGLNRGR